MASSLSTNRARRRAARATLHDEVAMTAPLLLALALAAPSAQAADIEAGKAVYMANCMACHGTQADGKGPAAAALQPPPADFTSAEFWKTRTAADVKNTIQAGKPGTAMMPFANLSGADLDNLVAFLQSKAP